MRRSLMLDSGAYTVWTKGSFIDLEEYIHFCTQHPKISYYVNLDVIPGSFGARSIASAAEVEECASQGWKNYIQMTKSLPLEKVIPVFHCGESFSWLERMLDHGVPYIGIGFGVLRLSQDRLRWIKKLRKYLLDSSGDVIRKVHGFGLTSMKLMQCFPWYSVDSATWVQQGGRGVIYVPSTTNGEFDFTKDPSIIAVSDVSPCRGDFNGHISTLSPLVKERVDKFLEECQIPYGVSEQVDVPEGYKLRIGFERWAVKGKRIVRVSQKGIMTCDQRRKLANALFFIRVGRALPLRLYLAGMGLKPKVERVVENRLLSYIEVKAGGNKALKWHMNNTEQPND